MQNRMQTKESKMKAKSSGHDPDSVTPWSVQREMEKIAPFTEQDLFNTQQNMDIELELLGKLFTAASWDARKNLLNEHPELLSTESESALRGMGAMAQMTGSPNDVNAAKQLICVVRRCREVGVQQTFKDITKK